MSAMSVSNLVISAQLNNIIAISHIHNSNSELCYEPELFPAVLISRWLPIHVAVFHNGKVIVTGLKSEDQAHHMLDSIIHYLHVHNLVK